MKEIWIQHYEATVEEFMEDHDIAIDAAEEMLNKILENDPGYLNDAGYLYA